MGDKKEYRSAIRSRKLIRSAFMEILKEKSLEQITVTDIVKKADINRSTFYAHYPDVLGVLEEIQNEILEYFEIYMSKIDFSNFFQNPKPYLISVIQIAEENQELYRLLMRSSVAVRQMENLKRILIEKIVMGVELPKLPKDSFEFEFSVRFFMGGFVDLYTQWLNGDVKCSLDEMTDELSKLILRVYESSPCI